MSNTTDKTQNYRLDLKLPSENGTYDEFTILLNDKDLIKQLEIQYGIHSSFMLMPGEKATLAVKYKTRGIEKWNYNPCNETGKARNVDVTVNTNFQEVDFPAGCLSPTQRDKSESGYELHWKAANLLSSASIGVSFPEKINPGPLVMRITFFAPVCLIFFFILIASITILHKINIHPMHYLFVASGFFAFHLLFAYLVDVIDVHIAFVLSSITTMLLVNLYMRAALGKTFPVLYSCGGQLFYLVLFSYSFFLNGITGLTIAIGSIMTLAVFMALTAKIDWDALFTKSESAELTENGAKV